MNGWEFLRRQSSDPSIADIPTIVLSSSGLPAGAKHELAKPVDRTATGIPGPAIAGNVVNYIRPSSTKIRMMIRINPKPPLG